MKKAFEIIASVLFFVLIILISYGAFSTATQSPKDVEDQKRAQINETKK